MLLSPWADSMKRCYCGFECEKERELREHVLKTHGARDGDWKTWEEA